MVLMKNCSPFLGLGLGVLFGILSAILAGAAAGGGHGSYLPAKLLFPFFWLLESLIDSNFGLIGLLAILQFPLYGLVLGISCFFDDMRRYLVGIVAAHLIAVMLIFVLSGTFSNQFPN